MKYTIQIISLCLLFLGSVQLGFGQISVGGEPHSLSNTLPSYYKATMMPSINMVKAKASSADNEFGFAHDVSLSIDNSGVWTELSSGDRIWRLNIHAPKATSINLVYSDFWLPEGASLYLYNLDYTQIIGGFTNANNKGSRSDWTRFGTGLISGENITLEYYEPANVTGEGQIEIDKVIHGHTSPFDTLEKGYKDSESCQINVNCPEGDDWQVEKTGVAHIVMGGYICSGALLNSHAAEHIPYFLTADHCSDLDTKDNVDASHWVFYWNYETPSCDNVNFNPKWNAPTTTGAILIANNKVSDFALFRLLEDPSFTGVWYLGWDSNNYASIFSGVGIHHPKGDAKKISIENDVLFPNSNTINWVDGNTSAPNMHWKVFFDQGGTEGGSSGSPLFDQNHRIVGQLHGGTGSCPDDPVNKSYYGKFSVSWTGNGNSSKQRRLKDWLAPECSSNLYDSSKTYYGENPVVRANKIQSSVTIAQSAFVRYEGEEIKFTAGFEAKAGVNFRASVVQDCNSSGLVNDDFAMNTQAVNGQVVSYVDMNIEDRVSTYKEELTIDDFSLFPNPSSGTSTIQFRLNNPSEVLVHVHNAQGQLIDVKQKKYGSGEHEIVLNPSNKWSNGIYFVQLQTNEFSKSKSLIIEL